MRKLLLSLTLLFFITMTVVAQGNNRDRIRALKTAHITNALSLTSSEAEKFWPVYNAYDLKIHQLKVIKRQQLNKRLRLAGGIDNISETEANMFLKEFIDIEYNIANENKKLHKNLTGIISSKKMIKLKRAKQSFNKELLKILRDRKFKRN